MGMADKATFMNRTEAELRKLLTAENMDTALKVISDVMQDFEMAQLPDRKPEKDDLLRTYLDAIRIMGLSAGTIERYRYIISRMMKDTAVPTRQITVYHLRNWLAREKERGIQDSTLEGFRQIFSSFFGWLFREGLIERNPVANLGAIKRQKKQKTVFTAVEIEKLNNACEHIRDRAILNFLRSSGCRISEMTQLNRHDVDLEKGECVVLGKGNKERTVYLDPVACMLIDQYLKGRTDEEPALFIGQRKERMQPSGVRQMLNVLSRKAGVEHVHPHKFRRTLATNLTRRGMQLQEVAHILGHARLDTTMMYVKLNNDDVKHEFRRCYE